MFHKDAIHISVLIYVDVILVTSTHRSLIFSLITRLQHVFKMKDLGDLNYFLGIQAFWTSSGLHLQQSKYIVDLLNRSKMLGAKFTMCGWV